MADETKLKYSVEVNADQSIERLEQLKKKILELREKIADLRLEKLNIVDANQIQNVNQQIRTLSAELGKTRVELDKLRFEQVNKFIQENAKITSQAGIALQSLNFVIRDSPYFLRDFSLGLLAIGNNLNPLIDSMIRAKLAAREMNMTLGQALLQSLKGPNGVIFAFSLLVAVIQGVVFALSKGDDETKKQKKSYEDLEKQLRKTAQAYIDFKMSIPSEIDYEETVNKLKNRIDEIRKKYDELFEKQRRTPLTQGEMIQFVEIQTNLNSLVNLLNKMQETRKEYWRVMENVEKIRSGEIKIEDEIQRLRGASNNQIRQYIRYVEEERDKVSRTSEEYKRLDDALQKLNKAFIEKTKAAKEDLKWVRELIQADKELFRERMRMRIEEGVPTIESQRILTPIPSLPQPLERLMQYYEGRQKEIGSDTIEYIKQENERLQDWINKTQARLEYEKLIREEQRLQLSYMKDIANSMDIILGKQKNWLSAIVQTLIEIVRIAQISQDISENKTSETTGGLGILSSVLSIIAIFAGFFDKGGIVFAKNGALIGDLSGSRAVPVIAHEGEMILNKRQQFNLFNMINRGAIGSGLNIHISGEIKARKNEFVVEIARAQKIYNNSVYLNA